MSHNCAGWSVLGVMGEREDLTMDYIKEEDLPEKGNDGYNLRMSDRLENQKRHFRTNLGNFPGLKVDNFLRRKEEAAESTVTIQHFTWDEVSLAPRQFPD